MSLNQTLFTPTKWLILNPSSLVVSFVWEPHGFDTLNPQFPMTCFNETVGRSARCANQWAKAEILAKTLRHFQSRL